MNERSEIQQTRRWTALLLSTLQTHRFSCLGMFPYPYITGDDVDLELGYLYGLFAPVMAQASGTSVANAFARVELF